MARIPGGASVRTRVEASFTLSLASIRYQAVRVFPDHADTGNCAVESDVIPGDETVIALTNALSEEGFYVKRVTENPPRGGGRAEVVHRVWDIAGRSYQGVYPVEFHLVLTGDEAHPGDVRPESGSTKIQIVVQGAYTDDEMYKQVENTWTQLRAVTEGSALPGARHLPTARARTAMRADASWSGGGSDLGMRGVSRYRGPGDPNRTGVCHHCGKLLCRADQEIIPRPRLRRGVRRGRRRSGALPVVQSAGITCESMSRWEREANDRGDDRADHDTGRKAGMA